MNVSSYIARVSAYTDDSRVDGCLHVGAGAGGQKCRVSDVLNDGTGFVVLTEVTIHEVSSGEATKEPRHYDTLMLRKGEIKFLIPFE